MLAKVKSALLFMMLFFVASVYGEEAVEVSSKLKKIGNDYLIFDIIIQNNSDRNLYFYPEGVLSRSNIVDDTLFIIIITHLYTNSYSLTAILSSEQYSITNLFSFLQISMPIVLL